MRAAGRGKTEVRKSERGIRMNNTFKVSTICIIFLLVLLLVTPAIMFLYVHNLQEQNIERQSREKDLEIERMNLEQENIHLRELLAESQAELQEVRGEVMQALREWLQQWEIKPVEITGFAPLDPRAVEGMCYSGDPNVTSSGAQTTPGITVAAPADIPFGTRVYVEGAMRVVQDRGRRIRYNDAGLMQLDLCVETREDALYGIGRREVMAVMERGVE